VPLLLTLLLAGLAAGLAVPGRAAGGRNRATPAPAGVVLAGRRRAPVVLLVALPAGGAALAAGAVVGGARGAVLVAAGLVAAGTVARVTASHLAEGRERRAQSDVAEACGVLASYVRVGQVAADALTLAAADCPVLEEAGAVQRIGGDVPASLRTRAAEPGHGGLGDLARAWQVSSTTGAPMAPALEEVAAGLASDESLRSVVSAELSAPRSTGKVMAVLPLVGIGLGYLLGGRPLAWLVAGPLGWVCLLGGLLLAGAGVLWIERLARSGAAGG
jgi:tight adherence protein B